MQVIQGVALVLCLSVCAWLLTGGFSPIIGSSSDIVISGVAPLHQCLHYSKEIHA